MKVVAIVQARMGSSRLPGKMLMDIGGKPAIAWVFERLKKAEKIEQRILATTAETKDDQLVAWAEENEIMVYRGSEHDVLDRFYQAAKSVSADVVVRITGDCPLLDPSVIDTVVAVFLGSKGECEYVSNVHPPTFPDGFDTEVFSFNALEKAWQEARLQSEREHVTPFIWKQLQLFKQKNITSSEDYSAFRLTLDTIEDLELIRLVTLSLSPQAGLKEIIATLQAHPDWQQLVSNAVRNEGYQKSMLHD